MLWEVHKWLAYILSSQTTSNTDDFLIIGKTLHGVIIRKRVFNNVLNSMTKAKKGWLNFTSDWQKNIDFIFYRYNSWGQV